MEKFEILKNKKVMVAMSGGVDSSVAAFLLKSEGYDVSGATMDLGIDSSEEEVKSSSGSIKIPIVDAKKVCLALGISHYSFDFSSEMKKFVIEGFIKSYMEGYTPNPCVLCNKFLKFDLLLKKAKSLGFDFFATGHYADITEIGGRLFLKKPADRIKDQTYFLYSIKKENLKDIIFPLAKHTKAEVRDIALKASLPSAEKDESQEVCFIPDNNYGNFLERNTKKSLNISGSVLNTEGKVIGKHRGIAYYTIGQRKGLGISAPEPLYVVDIDSSKNAIVLGTRQHIRKKKLIACDLNLFAGKLPLRAFAKIRYNHKESSCTISSFTSNYLTPENLGNENIKNREFLQKENPEIEVVFDDFQEAITPGQSIVFYDQDILIGGAVIKKVIS